MAAALAGQGVIYQPDFIVGGALAKCALTALELDQPMLDLGGLHVLFPPDRRPPAKVRAMIDYLVRPSRNDLDPLVDDRHRNRPGQCLQSFTALNRSELPITLTEDRAMAAAAMMGESSSPNTG